MSRYVDEHRRDVAAPPGDLWTVVEGIGGDRGWYSPALVWQVRGLLDRAVGGPGLRRGRRDPDRLAVGDPVDWWVVEELAPGRRLLLRAQARLPGTARLELAVDAPGGRTVLSQRVVFDAAGGAGSAYWWSVAPAHRAVFASMASGIARAAGRVQASREAGS